MGDRERTTIRIVGLAVHAGGFIWLVIALAGAGWPTLPGVLAFLVGGAWGWGMVVMAAREEAAKALAVREDAMRRERTGVAGFSATFDDEAETVIAPPPGTTGFPPRTGS